MARGRIGLGAVILAAAAAAAVRRVRPFPVRVGGDSMRPTLADGDLVAVTAVPDAGPRHGAVVVVARSDAEMVKRVAAPPAGAIGMDRFWVVGDNPAASTDSRHFGPVTREQIVGIARLCYWPPRSWRLLRASR